MPSNNKMLVFRYPGLGTKLIIRPEDIHRWMDFLSQSDDVLNLFNLPFPKPIAAISLISGGYMLNEICVLLPGSCLQTYLPT